MAGGQTAPPPWDGPRTAEESEREYDSNPLRVDLEIES
jgi:hypothetical protein